MNFIEKQWQNFMKEHLSAFSELKYRHQNYLDYDDYFETHLASGFYEKWLPAFKYFEGDNWWEKAIHGDFTRDLNNEHIRSQVFSELIRVFSTFDAMEANSLIHNKINNQKRN